MKKLLMLLVLVACNSDDIANNIEDKISDNLPDAGLTSSEIIDVASSTLGSAGAFFPNSSLAVVNGNNCEDMVTDLSSDSSGIAEFIGCMLTSNSKNPETLNGSFHLVNEIIGLIESNTSFQYDSSYTTVENIQGTIDTSDGNQVVNLSMKERGLSTGPWDYEINLCLLSIDGSAMNTSIQDCESGSFNFTVFLKDSNGKIGFKTIDRLGSFGGGTSFMANFLTQELRFEGWDEANGRHSRAYIKGTVSPTSYNLSALTKVVFTIAGQGIETSGNGTDAVMADFDGTNLCLTSFDDDDNDHSTSPMNATANLVAMGTCATHPAYNGGFFNASGLEAFLTDPTKGELSFTDSNFGISSYFINQ